MKLSADIATVVGNALAEDVGSGDITAALIAPEISAKAKIISRETAIICGTAWVDEVCHQVDPHIAITWYIKDGDAVTANHVLCHITGPARSILTAERCALNFLQTLSGTATITNQYVKKLGNTKTKLLDTRKTIPGLRSAQKYAVKCGGGENHRLGLYDAFLIKENHIAACGSITKAIKAARAKYPDKPIEIEVEGMTQLREALAAKADIILLDNFALTMMHEAVMTNAGKAKLEVSGNVDLESLHAIALTGVDYISVGALTKNVRAIDLSLRFLAE